jgi:uncharacterized metal-binding protein YceD (DUF177 family)
MNSLKEFIIPFSGLKEGNHEFEFGINDSFFDNFPESEIKQGSLHAKALMVKRTQMLTFDIELKGEAKIPCDRCGNEYRQTIEGQWQIVVKLEAEQFNDEDDLISLPSGAYQFDISQYLYEYISLLIPYRRVCAETPDPSKGNCDPEILEKLGNLSANTEEEEETDDNDSTSDPRWNSLRNMKFDN